MALAKVALAQSTRKAWRALMISIAISSMLSMLQACGQKGDLYLPSEVVLEGADSLDQEHDESDKKKQDAVKSPAKP